MLATACFIMTLQEDNKYFKIRGSESSFDAVVCIPTLSSLKDAVMGDNVEVLDVKSR
jgi:hypothetical protein